MEADEIDSQAKAAVERQQRIPMPHSRKGLKLLRLLSRATAWVQNRNAPSVGTTVDRTISGPDGDIDVVDALAVR